MSGNNEEEKDNLKSVPLDLARNQITTTLRTVEGKAPLGMAGQSLRGMRVLTQGVSGNIGQTSSNSAIITTNIMPQAVIKQDMGRAQITNIITSSQGQHQAPASVTIQRPGQITLTTTPVVAQTLTTGTTYHVPRGPAVVANLAAPRSNVTTVRTPMIVTAQTGQGHSFVRPPRTPSPAQAWLTSSNGSHIKGATTVLSSPVRGATVGGKPQLLARTQSGVTQNVSNIRPGTGILHSAITIGQQGQIQSFKPAQTVPGIQALSNAVTIAQVLPAKNQAIVYNQNQTTQYTPTSRLTAATSAGVQRHTQPLKLTQGNGTRLSVGGGQSITSARILTPQTAVLAPGARISAGNTQHQNIMGSSNLRIVSTQQSVPINRLAVGSNPIQVTSANILGQTRISTLNLHSLVAVASNSQARSLQTSGAKVITQPQGTIHLTPLTAPIKTSTAVVSSSTRTISVPTAIVTQRPAGVVSSQAIPIAKIFSQPPESLQNSNVFIHAPVSSSQKPTSSQTNISHSNNIVPSTTAVSYSLAGNTYFYDATGNYSVARPFTQQPTTFAAISQSGQSIKPSNLATQVHGNQQMRYNSVMVVEQSRGQQQQFSNQGSELLPEQAQQLISVKATASPRPSILRKRDHEGSPLKAAKNLNPVLANLSQLHTNNTAPLSPPSRPDSRGNGHSSGGSTTISATSSPGLAEVNEDSMPPVPMNKEEDDVKPPTEMSPRKKPRKQQLTGNDLDEHNDDMQFISENALKKDEDSDNHSDEPRDGAPEGRQITTVRKPASASLLNGYRQTWKATHNHYLRYADVRPKDERRPSIMDLANQYRVQEKINGWKIHHLTTQMEDLADQEDVVYTQLNDLLKCTESQESKSDKDVNRINELIKGNLQRIKIINDGMIEAKSQIMKIFDHKVHVTDIINRCASKRNFKKREKS